MFFCRNSCLIDRISEREVGGKAVARRIGFPTLHLVTMPTTLEAALARIRELEEQLAGLTGTDAPAPALEPRKDADASAVVLPASGGLSMPVYRISGLSKEKRESLLRRPVMNTAEIMSRVGPIIERVRKEGDAAVRALTEKFDGVKLDSVVLRPPFTYNVKEETKRAIDVAYGNIKSFHEKQLAGEGVVEVETMKVCFSPSNDLFGFTMY